MMERLRQAAIQLRRNRSALRRESGVSPQHGSPLDPPVVLNDARLFDNVDATAEELILYWEQETKRQAAKSTALTKWALAGLATEMTMHEANGLLSQLKYGAEGIANTYPDDYRAQSFARTVRRLDDNFSFLSRFSASGSSGWTAGTTGILKVMEEEFGRAIAERAMMIETTEAFRKSTFQGNDRTLFSVFNNLARNSYYWTTRSGMRPCVIRLDAKTVSYMGEDWDDETETAFPAMRETDIIVFEDNGPGVPDGVGDRVFDMGVSARGSTGIGLHLCRSVLENSGDTIILSDERSSLGGAIFMVGKATVLRPDKARLSKEDRPREVLLTEAVAAMTELVEGGFNAEAANLTDIYEEAAGLAARIRLRGTETVHDAALLEAVDAFERALKEASPIVDSVVIRSPK